jgi:hypothetical protein
VRLPDHPGTSPPPRALPWEFAIFAGFSGLLVLAAVFVTFPPGGLVGCGILLALTAATGWWATVPAGSAVGALAWLFYLGFVVHTAGRLGLRGPGDALVLALLITTGAAAAVLRRLLDRWVRTRRTRRTGSTGRVVPGPFQPATMVILVIPPPSATPVGNNTSCAGGPEWGDERSGFRYR